MTSDLSATALRDTVARVQKTLGDCDNHADLVCSSGDHHVDVGDLRTMLTALARLQEERDAARAWIAERVAEVPEVKAELRNLERSLAALGKENVILRAELAAARDGGTA